MMRYHILLLLMFAFCTSCKKQNKTELPAATTRSIAPVAGEKYVIDKKESIVAWKGTMLFAYKGKHTGFISISKGELMIEKDKLVGGKVEVDMNTMADEAHKSDNGLITHLRSPDFFDTDKFPTTTFSIVKVAGDGENVTVTGDLTIKGISHEVSFPVKAEVKAGIVNASGKLTIDRTQWDIVYKSGKLFNNLADEAISDDIEFDVKIIARK